MAIAINPDVRELDFSDNVKVSKFMQDFSDFRAKKWITYRPVNAPSQSDPFYGGTRQFVITMGTGHILDTLYSGLWFELRFYNYSDKFLWPLSTTMPKTSSAWIESVTFQHSNVAAHIDERLTDYDVVNALFTPTAELNTMKHTYLHYHNTKTNNVYNTYQADDLYGKLLPTHESIRRLNDTTIKFFIPLYRLSTIFNSGRYFFPSLLRGNGEMTISIRSVANKLSEIFGGANSILNVFDGLTMKDMIGEEDNVEWSVAMTNLNLITLNLDNAFLTKEYNAFIASGRKFIRSFKAYNYQYYEVKSGYNRIEIANTHQSISHVVLLFQSDYGVKINGNFASPLEDNQLYLQKTPAAESTTLNEMTAQSKYLPTTSTIHSNINNLKRTRGQEGRQTKLVVPSGEPEVPTTTDGTVAKPGTTDDFDKLKKSTVEKTYMIAPISREATHKVGILGEGWTVVKKGAKHSMDYILGTYGRVRDFLEHQFEARRDLVDTLTDASTYAQHRMRVQPHVNTLSRSLVRNGPAPAANPSTVARGGSGVPPRAPTAGQRVQQALLNLTDYGDDDSAYETSVSVSENHTGRSLAYLGETGSYREEDKKARELLHFIMEAFTPNETGQIVIANELMLSPQDAVAFLMSLVDYLDAPTQGIFSVYNTLRQAGAQVSRRNMIIAAAGLGAIIKDFTPSEELGLNANDKEIVTSMQKFFTININEMIKGEMATEKQRWDEADLALLIQAMGKNDELKAYLDQINPAGFSLGRIVQGRSQQGSVYNKILDEMSDLLTVTPYGTTVANMIEKFFNLHSWRMASIYTHILPAEAKQIYDIGMTAIGNLQVYRGTGNGETVFSEPVDEEMFYHISREAMGDSAENHPYFRYDSFRKDMAVIVISLNTFMRDAHHEFWDGFSTNRVADRLYVEFEHSPFSSPQASSILPWYDDIGYDDNNIGLNCKVFTIYDNIYYIDRNNNLNVSDTLLPLQEGRGPSTD